MDTLVSQPVFLGYALSVSLVVLMLYALGFRTAKIRNDRKIVVNPEDAGINGGASVAEADHPDVLRIKRAHQNLIENAVPFFAIGFLYCLTNPSQTVAWSLFGVFIAARVLHGFFYLSAKQPFRTLTFAAGALVNLWMVFRVMWTFVPLILGRS